MGTATDIFVAVARNANDSSHRFGECEVCGKYCPDVYAAEKYRIYRKKQNNQEIYYIGGGAGAIYGHLSCLIGRFGDLIEKSTMPKFGNLYTLPDYQVTKFFPKNN